MGISLGLLAALLYGGSDFAGGLASRRMPSVTVNLIGAISAAVAVWGALLASGGPAPMLVPVLWGVAGGAGSGLGSLALYRGLARGQMNVVGPVSAVAAAVVPVIAGLALGERPGPLAIAGIVVALPAIALVATSGGGFGGVKLGVSLVDGLSAGTAFGVLFIAMARAGSHDGLWPVAAGNVSSLLLIIVFRLASKPARSTGTGTLPALRHAVLPVFAGVSGAAATLMFFFSSHMSMLATAAVIVSLYPGVTVLLARVVLHERFSGVQRVGVGLCALAVIAIAVH